LDKALDIKVLMNVHHVKIGKRIRRISEWISM